MLLKPIELFQCLWVVMFKQEKILFKKMQRRRSWIFKMEEMLDKLENEIKSIFHLENSGHDLYHAIRVCNLSRTIQKEESGNKFVVEIASYLHDIHRIIQNETGNIVLQKILYYK